MTLTDSLKALLDQPVLRLLLAPLVSRLARHLGRGVTRIFYEDGVWIHETCDGYFAYCQPFLRLDLSNFERATKANFFWGYTPNAGDVIVDIGAGVGEEALTFSRAVGESGRVICVEASPRTCRCLQKLVQHNRLNNVTIIPKAVSDCSAGLLKIEDSRDYLRNRVTSRAGSEVPASTIDEIFMGLGLRHVNFLKMNIEGAERFAMIGMRETLENTEVLCICCHDFLADSTGDNSLRTKNIVRQFFHRSFFQVVERPAAGLAPYIRDQVWAFNQKLVEKAG